MKMKMEMEIEDDTRIIYILEELKKCWDSIPAPMANFFDFNPVSPRKIIDLPAWIWTNWYMKRGIEGFIFKFKDDLMFLKQKGLISEISCDDRDNMLFKIECAGNFDEQYKKIKADFSLKEGKIIDRGEQEIGVRAKHQPVFDEESGKIKSGNNECKLPFKKIEYYIIQALFECPPETKLIEDDFIKYFDSEACKADSPSRVYDATIRINKRIKKDLGIDKFIQYENSNYWLRKIS